MSVIYDPGQRVISINTKHTTYQMHVDRYGSLLHMYYGRPNPGFVDTPLVYADRGFSANPAVAGNDRTYSLDSLPQEYPTLGTGDYRQHALNIENADGSQSCHLLYSHHEISDGKYSLPGLPAVWVEDEKEAQTLEVVLRDPVNGIEVSLLYGVLPDLDIITRAAVIRNKGDAPCVIRKAATATLDFISGRYDILALYGRHAMERQVQRIPVPHGVYFIGSSRGMSSHEYNPAVVLARPDTTEDMGECWGMVFVYSGNFLCEAEMDQYDQTRLTMGLNNELFSWPLEPGAEFVCPEVILACSDTGFSGLTDKYQRCIRDHVCRGKYAKAKRPVVLNSWEATYFDFTAQNILDLARQAASVGIDMVVMDDGWFGDRNDDNSSLGDWYVNREKLGIPLKELVEQVNALGVEFGIWMEPEMVSEDSQLFREHPDWAIRIRNRGPVRGRNQLLLDFSRKEVRQHIFDQVCAILDEANIRYLKWDMNRSMSDVYDSRLPYSYVLGLYHFLERLTNKYPDLLIEGCSGGGGRFDAGMLYYTPQIWTSDNTDAINRTKIQYGTSLFYPLSSMAAHVSAVPNHQTGRVTSLYTRGVVAMTGAFGYELDLGLLSEDELDEVRAQVKTYKKYEDLIANGKYRRLSNPFTEKVAAWMSVSESRDEALLSAVRLQINGFMPPTYIRLKDLDPEGVYLDTRYGKAFSGAFLMETGYPLPEPTMDYEAYQLLLVRCTAAEELARKIEQKLEANNENVIVGIYGCSGSGKTTLGHALSLSLAGIGIPALTVSGDDYVNRTPEKNDALRETILETQGEAGLEKYLGEPWEINFSAANDLFRQFREKKPVLRVRRMGRGDTPPLWKDKDAAGAKVLILEWTHAGSPHLDHPDMRVYIDATPEEMHERRLKRGRNANADSELIRTVLKIEQEKLDRAAQTADTVVTKDGHIK